MVVGGKGECAVDFPLSGIDDLEVVLTGSGRVDLNDAGARVPSDTGGAHDAVGGEVVSAELIEADGEDGLSETSLEVALIDPRVPSRGVFINYEASSVPGSQMQSVVGDQSCRSRAIQVEVVVSCEGARGDEGKDRHGGGEDELLHIEII